MTRIRITDRCIVEVRQKLVKSTNSSPTPVTRLSGTLSPRYA